MTTEEQIRDLAYAIWEQEGCPEGKREEHYYRAKQILEAKEATSTVNFEQPPPVINLPPPPEKKKRSPRHKEA
jgi:hypothetical protein